MVLNKRSKGRKKIEIKKIEKKDALQVTFSKRRTGVFNKAFELCMLTKAEIAILVYSPGEKIYSFGHPSTDAVVDRFLHQNCTGVSPVDSCLAANLQEVKREYNEVRQQFNAEQKRGEKLASQKRPWWETPIEDLSLHELEPFKAALEDLKKNVESRFHDEKPIRANAPPFLPEMT